MTIGHGPRRGIRIVGRFGTLAGAVLLASIIAAGIGWTIATWRSEGGLSATLLIDTIRSWGMWGVAGSIALMIAHSFLFFPSEILCIANGAVYGAFWGAVITWTGAMLAASIMFALVRRYGRPALDRILPAHQREKLDRWTLQSGAAALLAGRLIPLLAFNLVNCLAALTTIRWPTYLWVTGVGILPLTIILSLVGAYAVSTPPWAFAAFVAVAAISYPLLRRWGRRASLTVVDRR